MPLAGHERTVSARTQRLGNGDTVVTQVALVGPEPAIVDHVPHAGLVRVEAGQQRGPRRTAPGTIVGLGKADAACRQAIQVRRRDLGAIASQVRVAHVVGQDEHNVGWFGG